MTTTDQSGSTGNKNITFIRIRIIKKYVTRVIKVITELS